jgi:hypothetical protein
LAELASASVAQPRFYMLLLAGFAGVALVLATVGIFGVISYAVSQRTREIGIRMALGADPTSVVTMVLKQALTLVGLGIGLGVLLALALSRRQKLLFNLSPTDPATISGVALLLTSRSSPTCPPDARHESTRWSRCARNSGPAVAPRDCRLGTTAAIVFDCDAVGAERSGQWTARSALAEPTPRSSLVHVSSPEPPEARSGSVWNSRRSVGSSR